VAGSTAGAGAAVKGEALRRSGVLAGLLAWPFFLVSIALRGYAAFCFAVSIFQVDVARQTRRKLATQDQIAEQGGLRFPGMARSKLSPP
jgi:hypothetical protein